MGWANRWRKRLRAVVRQDAVDREMHEELKFHLEMEVEKNLRAGMSPGEARRQAALAFGGVAKYEEEVREARALSWVDGVSLDVKLGVRMLVKYPGLTLVAGLAMAFAIAIGAGAFEAMLQLIHPALPFENGGRIVAIRNWDVKQNERVSVTVQDFAAWREQVASIEALGAFRTLERNLTTEDGGREPVRMAEISASAFALTGVAPVLGRALIEADEQPGAPPVVVIGYDVWHTRFGGRADVLGRSVGVGRSHATIVGVMPEGFGFPIAQRLWVPLPLDVLKRRNEGREAVAVFGRLAAGTTLEEAQAELTAVGQRAAAHSPGTHAHLRPQVLPYKQSIFPVYLSAFFTTASYSGNLLFAAFVVLVSANVALLMFARAAAREAEIIVRNALGASRRRIVSQFVVEALVLAAVAALVGTAAAGFALRIGMGLVEADLGQLPFWFTPHLSFPSVFYAGVLTILGAIVAGVLPALKVTKGLGTRLRQVGAGAGGLHFGGVWTVAIVAQVAVSMVFVALTIYATQLTARLRARDLGFAAQEYLAARLEMDPEAPAGASAETSAAALAARFRATSRELERRLAEEPGVAGVTFADRLPGAYHPRRWTEVDVADGAVTDFVQFASVDTNFFETLGAPILAGRGFRSGDLASNPRRVIVNQSFVHSVLAGRNAVGRRIRFADPDDPDQTPGPWHEIVGVVRDVMLTNDPELPHGGGIYHPAAPGGAGAVHIAVHIPGDPKGFTPRFRAVVAALDPALRLYELRPLEDIKLAEVAWQAAWVRILAGATSVVLALSLAGIYAIMAFTVSRRTRDIGIYVALGAGRWRIVRSIFSRPLAQAGLGVLVGVGSLVAAGGGIRSARAAGFVAAYTALMMAVVMLACSVPVRRALRVEPTEALRMDG